MHVATDPHPDSTGDPFGSGDAARKRPIARALQGEIHRLMPRDRTVAIAVDGDDIAVGSGPARRSIGGAVNGRETTARPAPLHVWR